MARARVLTKSGYEEKGQKVARNADAYLSREGAKEAAVCTDCKAVYRNKHWYMNEAEVMSPTRETANNSVLCPACHRMRDDNPAGIVTFAGDYLAKHENEILNIVKNIEAKTHTRNPLARIMAMNQEGDVLTITTTDDRLAQKLGRDIYRAHSGRLDYHWNTEETMVRVNWSR